MAVIVESRCPPVPHSCRPFAQSEKSPWLLPIDLQISDDIRSDLPHRPPTRFCAVSQLFMLNWFICCAFCDSCRGTQRTFADRQEQLIAEAKWRGESGSWGTPITNKRRIDEKDSLVLDMPEEKTIIRSGAVDRLVMLGGCEPVDVVWMHACQCTRTRC